MERCPTCQARLREPPVCSRCGTDLSLPLAAEAKAAAKLRLAVARLAEGDIPMARQAVEESMRLKRGPLAAALRGFLLAPRRYGTAPVAPAMLMEDRVEDQPRLAGKEADEGVSAGMEAAWDDRRLRGE
jgi:hypothetical protein